MSTIVDLLVPWHPTKSRLIQRVMSADPDLQMPPPASKLTLTLEEVELLTRWVEEGAKYSVHWAFVKPERPAVPNVAPTDFATRSWPRNDIDAFVLKQLEQAGLQPSPEADKATLIRRLSLDLTGLPLALDEVDRFLSDGRPDAYPRLVDRLLGSRHFGERMAQDWLDLARYGDTNGYEDDSDREMWLYRDWVINAFNTNKPFDRFTIEQIAGDLLPDADDSQRIASGFNRNTTFNEESGSDPEEFQVVYAVERASTTSTVFLGLTMGCAQCHEHKYDPISQREFYQFYAFFNSVDGERGAEGHNIPLPPLIRLPTRQQATDLKQTRVELETLNEQIAKEVAKVDLERPSPGPLATEASNASSPADLGEENAGDQAEKKDADEKVYFDELPVWEEYERKREKSRLPDDIRDSVRLKPEKRSAEQQKKLRDYFIAHAYSKTRAIFEPLVDQREELRKKEAALDMAIPMSMVMKEMAESRPAYVLIRGDFEQKGERVTRDVPSVFPPLVLSPLETGKPPTRLSLAHWLTDPNHPLVARVAVNRFWKQLFGTGLVKTMEDFGVRGEFPSHPELLDWLATEFVRTGWDVKTMLKTIAFSAAYRQSSRYRPEAAQVDPYNRLLARQNRFRLAAEAIRDTALAVSGLLNDEVGGPSVYPYQPADYFTGKGAWEWHQSKGRSLYRRGLYTFWRRTTFYPSFLIFDAPSRETCTVDRPRTNTPLQALVTLNDPTFVEAARVFAERILRSGGQSLDDRLRFAFRVTLARPPDEHEREILAMVFAEQLTKYSANPTAAAALIRHGEHRVPDDLEVPQLAAWAAVANVLLNLDETITRE